jgi:hypothetical protein
VSFRVNNQEFTDRHAYLIRDALKNHRHTLYRTVASEHKSEGARDYSTRKILEIEGLERELDVALRGRRVRVRATP